MPVFMKITRGKDDQSWIKGDSTDPTHIDWIEVDSVGWGVQRQSSVHPAMPLPTVQDAIVSKEPDRSTTALASFDGRPFTVVLEFSKKIDDITEVYMTITLTEAIVSSYWLSSGGLRRAETIDFNFAKFLVEYPRLDKDSAPYGSPGWSPSPKGS